MDFNTQNEWIQSNKVESNTSDSNLLSQLTFEQIQGNYWYGAYGEFSVIMMKDTGFVNATKMCQSGGKDYKNWTQNKNSQDLIQIVESDISSGNGVLAVEDDSARFPAEASAAYIFIQTMQLM